MATIQIYSNFADVALAAYAANLDANNARTNWGQVLQSNIPSG